MRSGTWRPSAPERAWRFSVGVRRMSQAPLARGPTASFSMYTQGPGSNMAPRSATAMTASAPPRP